MTFFLVRFSKVYFVRVLKSNSLYGAEPENLRDLTNNTVGGGAGRGGAVHRLAEELG